MKKLIFLFAFILVFGLFARHCYDSEDKKQVKLTTEEITVNRVMKNYKKKVLSLSKTFDLPPSYLLALIMLESSGKRKVKARYEKSIYQKLRKVKKGKMKKFENIEQKDLKKLSNKTLKKLSCSYGPFQIMGYKCFFLDIPLKKLTGKTNMYYAAKWIKLTYGESLRNKEYKDAFHMHNAGKKYPKNNKPKTHDPNYVKNGLKYEKIFREKLR